MLTCSTDRQALVEPVIEQRIQERMKTIQKRSREKCYEELMEEALMAVDSLLQSNPLLVKIDSLTRPPIPEKPVEPILIRPKDSLSLAPLINTDTLSKDTTPGRQNF